MEAQTMKIIIYGVGFMTLFIGFHSSTLVQCTVIEGFKKEGGSFKGNGFIGLSVVNFVFSLAILFAPVFTKLLGPTKTLLAGSSAYVLYAGSFIMLNPWAFYITSVLVGIGGALVWCAQSEFLYRNSSEETIIRNTGIFWAFLKFGILAGNFITYMSISEDIINKHTRQHIYKIFTATAAFGPLFFLLIVLLETLDSFRTCTPAHMDRNENEDESLCEETVKTVQCLTGKDIRLLIICIIYSGVTQAFMGAVYATMIGHTKNFGDNRKRLIGFHGIMVVLGEILGGFTFGILGNCANKLGRESIILIAFICHLFTFYQTFINFPSNSIAEESAGPSPLQIETFNAQCLVFIGSILSGFADSSINTQIFFLLALKFNERSHYAVSVSRFAQSSCASILFAFAAKLKVSHCLGITCSLSVIGTLIYFYEEAKIKRQIYEGILVTPDSRIGSSESDSTRSNE